MKKLKYMTKNWKCWILCVITCKFFSSIFIFLIPDNKNIRKQQVLTIFLETNYYYILRSEALNFRNANLIVNLISVLCNQKMSVLIIFSTFISVFSTFKPKLILAYKILQVITVLCCNFQFLFLFLYRFL